MEMIKKFFLYPTNILTIEFNTLPVQLSFPQANCVSVPTPDLSPLSANLYQLNYSPIPPEDNDLEEPLSQSRSQSRTEARSSLTSNLQLPFDGTNAELVGLVVN